MPKESQKPQRTINPNDPTPKRASHHKRRFVLELIEDACVGGVVTNVVNVGAYMITEDTDGNVVSSTIDKTSIAHKTGGWVVDMLNTYATKMQGVIELKPVTENLVPDTGSFAEDVECEEVLDGEDETN